MIKWVLLVCWIEAGGRDRCAHIPKYDAITCIEDMKAENKKHKNMAALCRAFRLGRPINL